jgi:hypothetical protein
MKNSNLFSVPSGFMKPLFCLLILLPWLTSESHAQPDVVGRITKFDIANNGALIDPNNPNDPNRLYRPDRQHVIGLIAEAEVKNNGRRAVRVLMRSKFIGSGYPDGLPRELAIVTVMLELQPGDKLDGNFLFNRLAYAVPPGGPNFPGAIHISTELAYQDIRAEPAATLVPLDFKADFVRSR